MKKTSCLLFFVLSLIQISVKAQNYSPFSVKYMVTFNEAEKQYTAWVVPEYETPNVNNGSSEEKGATAQFSLKVPKGARISDIQDIKGSWDKQPTKFGSEPLLIKSGADKAYEYYVIGKNPSETNYGSFKNGEPVALFKFKAKGATNISALEANDPIVKIADDAMSLNVRGSFYSRSGQKPTLMATPLEQFIAPIELEAVLSAANARVGNELSQSSEIMTDSKVITFPNPAKDVVTVKFFWIQESLRTNVDLVDLSGSIKQTKQLESKLGFNTVQMTVANLPSGTYLIRTTQGAKVNTNKVIKVD